MFLSRVEESAGYLGGLESLVKLGNKGARLKDGLCGSTSGYVIMVVCYYVMVFIRRVTISRLVSYLGNGM